MRIQRVQQQPYQQKYTAKQPQTPSFGILEREVKVDFTTNIAGKILRRNNTCMYRSDLNWNELAKFLWKKYLNTDKVNVYNYACSSGEEVYSFLIKMFESYGRENCQKFLPVIARDIDPFVIKLAKEKLIKINEDEKLLVNHNSYNKFNKYFIKNSKIENLYQPTEILTQNVKYNTGDFTQEIETLPKDNLILFVRNCWPYFPMSTFMELPENLYKHLGENCTVIVGAFDLKNSGILKYHHCGFKETHIPHVYEK